MNDSDKYFREKDIREFLKTHVCAPSFDGAQLLYVDENDRWADMLNALPVYRIEEITNEI